MKRSVWLVGACSVLLLACLTLVVPASAAAGALSSISIGPDTGASENVGSAMSAEIDLDELQAPQMQSDGGGVEEVPVSIPPGTPTTMSATSIAPTQDTSTTLSSAPTESTEQATPGTSGTTTSVPVPSRIDAGGGGTANDHLWPGAWLGLLVLGGVVAMGLATSAVIHRGTSGN